MAEITLSPIKSHQHRMTQNINPNLSLILDEKMSSEDMMKDNKGIKRKTNVNEETLRVIRNMNIKGYKAKEIATITDLTKSTVYKYIERMNTENPPDEDMSSLIKKRGRKKSENTSLQNKIKEYLDNNTCITLKQMKDALKEEQIDISISYLSKTIKKMGLRKRTNNHNPNVRKSQQMYENINDTMYVAIPSESLPPATNHAN